MPDLLSLTDLELSTRIGVSDAERKAQQKLLVTVEMTVSALSVARDDDVAKGIDYAVVAEDLRTLAKTERKTIERFAEDIAAMVLKRHRPLSVRVTVKKFVIPGALDVRVTIERS